MLLIAIASLSALSNHVLMSPVSGLYKNIIFISYLSQNPQDPRVINSLILCGEKKIVSFAENLHLYNFM